MEIYVHMIDGAEVWVPVSAVEVSPDEYRILASDTFDSEDTTVLMQFIPGDVVRLHEGRAVELVSSLFPDREYWSILYEIVTAKFPSDPDPSVVNRIVSEVKSGTHPHYPAVIEWATEHA